MAGVVDTDVKAYWIAAIGGFIGGALGSKIAVVVRAYLPVIMYQMGLDIPPDALGLGNSQVEKGFTRFFNAELASLVPGFVGLICGAILLLLIHGID